MPYEKKRRRGIIDELFSSSLFDEMEEIFKEFPEEELAGGYSISVTQTPEGTKVKAKVGKGVDANALRRRLQQQYPGAQIEIEGGRQEILIKEISTKPSREDESGGEKEG